MKVGLALRGGQFPPEVVGRIASRLNDWKFSSIWFNDGPGVLDISGFILGSSKRTKAATGVLRLAEYDIKVLAGRVAALNRASGNRFILGVGTGRGTGESAIKQLVENTNKFRAEYPDKETPPTIYFSALRSKMTRASFEHAEGVLLNFASAAYIEKVLPKDLKPRKGFQVAGYVKLFFSKSDDQAKKMLIDEFAAYNSNGNYHSMFVERGLDKLIDAAKADPSRPLPDELLKSSLYNPSMKEVGRLFNGMAKAGMDLPVVSLYAEGDEAYKLRVVRQLASLAT